MLVQGIALRFSGFVVTSVTHQAILPAQLLFFYTGKMEVKWKMIGDLA